MKLRTRWLVAAVVLVAVGLWGLNAAKARKDAKQPVSKSSPATVQALQLAPGDVHVAMPIELTQSLAISGSIKAVNTAVVKARVGAEIKSLTVREGDVVKQGQVIGQLDTTDVELRARQADQTAETARAQLAIVQRTLDNNRPLVAQGFISATGLETSIANRDAALASLRAAEAASALARKSIQDARLVAPISGTVSQRLAQPGERVTMDARVVEIVDLSRLELEAPVAPEDIGAVRAGQTAHLNIDGFSAPVTATVARINPSTQTGTRAIMVYLSIAPGAGLRQGMFARGSIELSRSELLAVPVNAVRVDKPQPHVLLVEDGKVVLRTVNLGRRGTVASPPGEAFVEIVAGLAPGAAVLRAGVGAVREGSSVNLPADQAAPGLPASAAASAPAGAASSSSSSN